MNNKGHIKAQIALGLVCAALTFAIATQIPSVTKNVATENKRLQRTEDLQMELSDEVKLNKDLEKQLLVAQGELSQYRNEAANSSDYAKILSDQLKRSEIMAGLTAVEGPGIVVTISDSTANRLFAATPQENEMLIIHDSDLRMTISELAAAGAEAYSINGERIIGTTPIRCVGPVITVNEKKMAPPFEITVIGDPKTLEAAVNMRGGLKDMFESVGNECSVEVVDKLVVPRFSGPISFLFAKSVIEPVTDAGGDQ